MTASVRACFAPALVGLALLGVSACDRGSGAKETTASSSSAPASVSSTPATPSVSVSPINDKEKLCSRALGRVREINTVGKAYWDLVLKSGFGDPSVNDAGDKFRETTVKTLPLLKGLPGPEAPSDVATAISTFADDADKFSEAAGAHSTEDELNPLASKYGDALDAVNQICGKS